MKNYFLLILLLIIATSCQISEKPIVSVAFVDSLVTNNLPSKNMKIMEGNLSFWQNKIEESPDYFVNTPQYAGALASRFQIFGDIEDLRKADSLMQLSNKANQGQEPSILRSLASFAMQQHQFIRADSLQKKAMKIDTKNVGNVFFDFDVSFERGNILRAEGLLKQLKTVKTYGYFFRKSKMEHYSGSLDSAIVYMEKAIEKADNNKNLRQIALSNTADLYIHKGEMARANQLFMESLRIDAADFHSIMGLGWIALVHDKNDALATKIFQFVRKKQHSPDAIFKLMQVAEAKKDSLLQKKYAQEFVQMTTKPAYGQMYNKYLIDIFTGILNTPQKAVLLAEKEIESRPTPQVYAWYVYALFCNKEIEKAYQIYQKKVSEQPLEALELYYMGKMMQGMKKNYNAQQFFEAAYQNKYDLSPKKVADLDKILGE